eukprot:2189333-Rhodomonas_salina.2
MARLKETQEVVVKVPWNSERITEIMQEIKVAAKVGRHPNLVPMIGVCTHTVVPMIVTELQGGGTLEDLLAERSKPRSRFSGLGKPKPIPERTCIPWMRGCTPSSSSALALRWPLLTWVIAPRPRRSAGVSTRPGRAVVSYSICICCDTS